MLASQEKGIKDYHEKFSTVKSIASIPALRDHVYDKQRLAYDASYYHVTSLERLGDTLSDIASSLAVEEQRHFAFSSENHVMAFSVSRKERSKYIVKFYDPNKTNQHTGVLCENLDDLKKISINDLISEANLNIYFPVFKTGVIASGQQRKPNEAPVVKWDQKRMPMESMSYFSLREGIVQYTEDILKDILASQSLERDEKIALLTAKDFDEHDVT